MVKKVILRGLPLARKQFDGDKYEEAHKTTSQVLKDDPDSFDALLLQSEIECKLKTYDSALTNAIKALIEAEAKDDNALIAKAYRAKSTVYFRLKCFYEALQQIVYAQKLAPDDGEITLYKSMIYKKFAKASEKTTEEIAELEEKIKAGYVKAPVSSKKKVKLEAKKETKPVAKPATKSAPSKPEPKIVELDEEAESKKSVPAPTKTTSAPAPKPAPVAIPKPPAKQNLRTDWYDTSSEVSIQVFVKFIQKDSVKAEIKSDSLGFTFQDKNKFEYEYKLTDLQGKIDPEKSSYRVFGTKLEITLFKSVAAKWEKLTSSEKTETEKELQGEVFSYPSSASKKIDWAKLDSEAKGEGNEDEDTDSPDYFFKKLYKDADEDTRRAMMKSYVESQGTALSTDWKDVSSKKYEPVTDDKYKDDDEK